MSSNALESQGMELAIGSAASPTVYTHIPEIKSISGPTGSATVIDVTDLDSVAKEKRLGLKDQGQLTLDVNWIPSNAAHAALKAAFDSGDETAFRMTFTDSGTTQWYMRGFVNGLAISNGVDAVLTASVTIELTGDILEA